MSLSQMMQYCYFGHEQCRSTDFEYFFDINYGNCYKFNSGFNSSNQSIPVSKAIGSGHTYGFQLSLNLVQEELNDTVTY